MWWEMVGEAERQRVAPPREKKAMLDFFFRDRNETYFHRIGHLGHEIGLYSKHKIL